MDFPANIAEGNGRVHVKEYLHHVSIAYGSLMELETHIEIARRLAYIDQPAYTRTLQLSTEVGRMLNGLSQSLKRKLAGEGIRD